MHIHEVILQNGKKQSWEGDFILFEKITVSTIDLPKKGFQMYPDTVVPVKVIGKSHNPRNKTFIRGASPGTSSGLWDKNAIGGRRCDITIIVKQTFGNWNRHFCRRGKFEFDRLSRSTIKKLRNSEKREDYHVDERHKTIFNHCVWHIWHKTNASKKKTKQKFMQIINIFRLKAEIGPLFWICWCFVLY